VINNKKRNKNMEFVSEHWLTLLGGGSITGLFGWIVYGRKNQKEELKSSVIDNEIKEIDYAEKVRDLYESILLKKEAEISYLSEQIKNALADAKEDREYFRSEINPLREELQSLRKKSDEQERQIVDLSLINAITKEAADSWEAKFKTLEKEHDKLKKDFDTLRKSMR
jgi:endo-beta-N-acetylglucosaminidase D